MSEPNGLVWTRFHSIYGRLLKLGVQTEFDLKSPEAKVTDEEYLRHDMVRSSANSDLEYAFHPAFVLGEDLREANEMRMIFVPQVDLSSGRFHKLVLMRKSLGAQTPWAVAARFPNDVDSEREVFGFSSMRSENETYLNLALPGELVDEAGRHVFLPLYVKLENPKKQNFVYVQIGVEFQESESEDAPPILFVVGARCITEKEAPPILRKAEPRR